jgi:outer membrane protein TolC
MNRPAESALGPVAPLQFIPFDLPETNLEVMALQHRPELLKAGKIIEAAAARLELAKRGWIPNPALRVEGSRYNQSSQAISEVTVGFSLNLPWFNRRKYSAAIRENKKRVEVAEQELEALQTQTLGLLRDHLRKIETYHHHAELFRSKLIPLAEQSVNTARLSFETDKTGFLNLLEAQRTLQETESEYWNHLTDFLSARAELEAMLGTNPDMKGTPATNHKEHHE